MRIGIIGGGIGGTATAYALLRQGFDVTIFEQAAAFGEVGAGVQMTPNAVKAIKGLGLSDKLLRAAFYPKAIVGRNWQSGRENFRIDLGDEFRRHYDAPFIHIHRADLLDVFATELPSEICRFGRRCVGVVQTETGARAEFEGGETFSADLIIGADGVRSAVRGALFEAGDLRWTGHQCYRALVPTDGVVDDVNPDSTFWMGPNAHVVTYYVKGGRMVNIVAVTEASEWVAESWSTRASRDQMLADFAGWQPTLQTLFARVDEVYNWGLFDRDPMQTWSKGAVTLLGDACHPMLPFLSQGAAMAIEDAYVLATALALHRRDLGAALQAYEGERLPRTARVQLEARERGRTYHLPSEEEMAARDADYARRAKEDPRTTGINTDWVYDYDPRAFARALAA
ncbi:FAD-dependent oxidoreductase [Methylobacterium frigidaeris]|uniref:6-hydroxynicotinate 3-monooxygenase n=2 Tax=Methylobacterium frigidaeris TaxID=2038277 RepID=A0AA37HED2_9HYPH|nr:FAD-dependent oxidoreductase [Methylobacterium frigidaeris]GJD64482.1 6-hydroxynicotinate 3-monooxygenase [Methylobacterium frigidaeris]